MLPVDCDKINAIFNFYSIKYDAVPFMRTQKISSLGLSHHGTSSYIMVSKTWIRKSSQNRDTKLPSWFLYFNLVSLFIRRKLYLLPCMKPILTPSRHVLLIGFSLLSIFFQRFSFSISKTFINHFSWQQKSKIEKKE